MSKLQLRFTDQFLNDEIIAKRIARFPKFEIVNRIILNEKQAISLAESRGGDGKILISSSHGIPIVVE